MNLRALLASLIIIATAAFVVGTIIERNASGESGHDDEAAAVAPASAQQPAAGEAAHSEAGGESAAAHAAEGAGPTAKTSAGASHAEAPHAELRPLGIDIEAWPFIVLAAIVSLCLAAAAWLRPQAPLILTVVAATMLAFAALDIREVVHQLDLSKNGLAVLSGAIAALHLAAAGVAGLMMSRSRHAGTAAPGSAHAAPT